MQIIQWIIAAGTAVFVALIGFFQWRTAQQKAVLDLFDRRHAIYEVVRKAVGQMVASSTAFDQGSEIEFIEAMDRAYFFFGDDVGNYLKQLWSDILNVRTADAELPAANDPRHASEDLGKTPRCPEPHSSISRCRTATICTVHAIFANCSRRMVSGATIDQRQTLIVDVRKFPGASKRKRRKRK